MNSLQSQLTRIESLIRRDPARRGLLAGDDSELGLGELPAAARDLAGRAREVAIVTGFAVPSLHGMNAETDGPLGAVILADVLGGLGINVSIITDDTCRQVLNAAMDGAGLDSGRLAICPMHGAQEWCEQFLTNHARLTHLVSIERVGPSHTLDSLRNQRRRKPPPIADFEALVPESGRNRCHNMRGDSLDEFTAPLHSLFEDLPRFAPGARSIGIGDGGNELGMGRFLWEELHPLVPGEPGPRMVCRIATDWTIVGGTCNWGGFGLAAAVALLRGRVDLIADWTMDRQEDLLQHLVDSGRAVDGVTREREPTVDGLPFITYAQACSSIIEECLREA